MLAAAEAAAAVQRVDDPRQAAPDVLLAKLPAVPAVLVASAVWQIARLAPFGMAAVD